MFSNYFIDKINTIKDSIQCEEISTNVSEQTDSIALFTNFQLVSEQAVCKIIRSCASKRCDLDPMPTHLVKLVLPQLLPIITAIINKSLRTGNFPSDFKQALVTPLLKKPTLDSEVSKNFRPVSNLSFISKVLEKVVAHQLNEHLMLNNFQDPYQKCVQSWTLHGDSLAAHPE
jgi:hypothetical protein